MQIARSEKNGYHVLHIPDDLGVDSDLGELKAAVDNLISSGKRNIAVSFTHDSFLYSRNIGWLIQAFEGIESVGGKMALIAPNEDIRSAVMLIGFNQVISILESEDELPEA